MIKHHIQSTRCQQLNIVCAAVQFLQLNIWRKNCVIAPIPLPIPFPHNFYPYFFHLFFYQNHFYPHLFITFSYPHLFVLVLIRDPSAVLYYIFLFFTLLPHFPSFFTYFFLVGDPLPPLHCILSLTVLFGKSARCSMSTYCILLTADRMGFWAIRICTSRCIIT